LKESSTKIRIKKSLQVCQFFASQGGKKLLVAQKNLFSSVIFPVDFFYFALQLYGITLT
jgi:hypothetical protein